MGGKLCEGTGQRKDVVREKVKLFGGNIADCQISLAIFIQQFLHLVICIKQRII